MDISAKDDAAENAAAANEARGLIGPDEVAFIDKRGHKPRERRCIASGQLRDPADMIRFVRSPDNQVTVDINGKLPGRGVWVSAEKTRLDQAIKSKGFARGFKGPAHIADDLEAQIIAALLRQLSGQLAMAKKSGQLIIGFDQVFGAAAKMPLAFRVEASDGAADGRGKIRARARALSYEMELAPPQIIGCFDAGQLGQIFGREHTIHAAMARGKMAQNMQRLVTKLAGFYPLIPADWPDRDHEHIDESVIG